jgi:hypothetical protein
MIWLWNGPRDHGPCVYSVRSASPAQGRARRTVMLKSAIMLLAVFAFCVVAVAGCHAEGDVGHNASHISAAR